MAGFVLAQLRATSLILGALIAVGGGSPVGAASLSPGQPLSEIKAIPEAAASPFGLSLVALPEGSLTAKWHVVEQAIGDDLKMLTTCRDDRIACATPAAIQFLDIIEKARSREGLARIGDINRAINLAIRPVSDVVQYGVDDLWTSPLATLKAGAGDCEDYAIAKLIALRLAGVSASDIKLVILRDSFTSEDHAIVAARSDGRWRLLDNRYFIMLDDTDTGRYRPIFAIDEDGAKRFEQPAVFAKGFSADVAMASQPAAVNDDARTDEALSTAAIAIAGLAVQAGNFAAKTLP